MPRGRTAFCCYAPDSVYRYASVHGATVRQIIGLRLEFTRRIEDCCS
jgi:hypothetical protein